MSQDIKDQLAAILRQLEGNAQPAQPQPAPQATPADDRLDHIVKTVAGLAESVARLTAPKPSTGVPVSDKGSAFGGARPDWRAELVRNPIKMSPASKQQMAVELGSAEKARSFRMKYINERAHQIRVNPPPAVEPDNGVTWDLPSGGAPKVES